MCGHGSRDAGAVAEFEKLSVAIRERAADIPVEYGFLEFATPVIKEGLGKLVDQGVTDVLAVPGMLFAAGHAKNDIPSVLNTWAAGQEGVDIRYGRELAIDLKMLRAAADRIDEALDAAGRDVPMEETMLVVVGRGASDPDANSNVTKVMRMLWEGFGFGWGETAYSGVTFPLSNPVSNTRPSSAISVSSCSRISCLPACWCAAFTNTPTWSRRGTLILNSSRRPI